LYICTRFKKHMSAFIPVNKIIIIFKDTSQWAKEPFNHRKEKEEINTDLWTECLHLMEEKYLRVVERKEDINWLFLLNQDTKNND
jgi:hypothetical protein